MATSRRNPRVLPRALRGRSRSRSRSRSRGRSLLDEHKRRSTSSPAPPPPPPLPSSGSSGRGGSRFRVEDCAIPQVWCGNGAVPNTTARKRYSGAGSPHQCMQKGFGAGMFTEQRKNTHRTSLQQISYVGDVYDRKFRTRRINSTDALEAYVRRRTAASTSRLLREVFTKTNGALDRKAYNSTVIYLYDRGVHGVPACERIS